MLYPLSYGRAFDDSPPRAEVVKVQVYHPGFRAGILPRAVQISRGAAVVRMPSAYGVPAGFANAVRPGRISLTLWSCGTSWPGAT